MQGEYLRYQLSVFCNSDRRKDRNLLCRWRRKAHTNTAKVETHYIGLNLQETMNKWIKKEIDMGKLSQNYGNKRLEGI